MPPEQSLPDPQPMPVPPEPALSPEPSAPEPEEPPAEPTPPPSRPDHTDSLIKMDPDEHEIVVIHKHPFSVIGIYIQSFLAIVVLIAASVFFLPQIVDRANNPTIYSLVGAGIFVIAIFLVIIVAIATYIYRQTRIIVTDKTITQVIQSGLFNRRISQLTIANIEDVNAAKRGFLQTAFNYGTLNMETAGEVENFNFPYCPNPDYFAKQVLEAREAFVNRHYGGREPATPERGYRGPV